jgi:hypothetical protein
MKMSEKSQKKKIDLIELAQLKAMGKLKPKLGKKANNKVFKNDE